MTGRDEQTTTAANRPVRQRNAVLHYSDNNPNTFTIKRRNGVIIDAPADVIASLSSTTTDGGGGAAPAAPATAATKGPSAAAGPRRRGSGASSSGAAAGAEQSLRRSSSGSSGHQDSEPASRRRGRPSSSHSVASAGTASSGGRKGAVPSDVKPPPPSSAPSSSGDSKRRSAVTAAPGGAAKSTTGPTAATRTAPRRGSAGNPENGGRLSSAMRSGSSVASSSSAATKTSQSAHAKGSASSKRPARPHPASASTPSSSPNRKRKFRPICPKDKWSAGVGGDDEGCDLGDDGDDRRRDDGGTILDHRIFYQPLVEPNQQRRAGEQSLPSSLLGGVQQAQLSSSLSWSALRVPTRLENHQELAKDPPITCWTSRPGTLSSTGVTTPNWAACGDAAGRVHLVSMHPCGRASVWSSVETLASRREELRTFPAKKASVTFPNSLVAVAWSRDEQLLAVLTEQELQCIDLLQGQASQGSPAPGRDAQAPDHGYAGRARSSDDFPPILVSDQPPSATPSTASLNRLVLEWKGDRLLWVTGNGPHPQVAVDERTATPASVYLVERGRSQPRPVPLHCLSATWDETRPTGGAAASENGDLEDEDRILAVIRQDKDSLALIRYDFRSNSILHAVTLSLPGFIRTVHIQRHDLQCVGTDPTATDPTSLITLCTPRGIHVHSGKSLECLSIVGESVALHGKSVSWDTCQFVPEPAVHGRRLSSSASAASKGAQKQQRSWFLVQDHEGVTKRTGLAPYQLVAVPQPLREPKELMSTLHIWGSPIASDSSHQSFAYHLQHPMTLALPSSPGGVLGWTVARDRFGGWRVLGVSAEFGSPFEWAASLQSDFAGREYPVGYKLLTDNVEYVEDEDEIDAGIVFYEEEVSPSGSRARVPLFATPPRPTSEKKHSKELEKAMKLSFEDAPVEVLLSNEERIDDDILAEMCPPRSFKRADDDGTDDVPVADLKPAPTTEETSTSSEAQGPAPLFSCFPQYDLTIEESKLQAESLRASGRHGGPRHLSIPLTFSAEVSQVNLTALLQKRGKKHSGVEGVLQVSVLPELRTRMDQLMRQWGDGNGSTCAPVDEFSVSSLSSRSPMRPHARTSKPVLVAHSEWEGNVTRDAERAKKGEDGDLKVLPDGDLAGEKTSAMHDEYEKMNSIEGSGLPATPLKASDAPTVARCGGGAIDSSDLASERKSLQKQLSSKAFERASPFAASNVSAEERELALELLLLSPGHHKPQSLGGDSEEKAAIENGDLSEPNDSAQLSFLPDSALTGHNDGDAVVTPSEQSPTMQPSQFAHSGMNEVAGPESSRPDDTPPSFCAACHGRLVIHRCGKRERPIDYEAIERAEQERKEREEAEKQQRRAEKRRAAEARRREARKKKKEEEDLKRFEEEERLYQLEVARKNSRTLESEAQGEESRAFNDIAEWDRGASQSALSPSKSQASVPMESPSKTAATHAFRLADPSSGSPSLYHNSSALHQTESSYSLVNRGDAETDKGPSRHLLSSSNPDVGAPKASDSHFIDQPPTVASIHGESGLGYNRHGFQASQPYSSEDGDTERGHYMALATVYGTQVEAGFPSTDASLTVNGRPHEGTRQAEVSQVSNSYSIQSSDKEQTDAPAALRTIDISKLEPSAPLSTADALEALAGLAGLANSLPAVPTNVSHNFSSASSWTQQSYSYASTDVTQHLPTSTSQFNHSLPLREYHYQSAPHVYPTFNSANGGQIAESGAHLGRERPAENE